jgi:hypothetical protein
MSACKILTKLFHLCSLSLPMQIDMSFSSQIRISCEMGTISQKLDRG